MNWPTRWSGFQIRFSPVLISPKLCLNNNGINYLLNKANTMGYFYVSYFIVYLPLKNTLCLLKVFLFDNLKLTSFEFVQSLGQISEIKKATCFSLGIWHLFKIKLLFGFWQKKTIAGLKTSNVHSKVILFSNWYILPCLNVVLYKYKYIPIYLFVHQRNVEVTVYTLYSDSGNAVKVLWRRLFVVSKKMSINEFRAENYTKLLRMS